MTLLNRQWQSVDGTRQIRIYPYIRRPDILSSNTYIFDTPKQIVLIDPGALAEQSEEGIPVATEELRTTIPVPFYRKTIPLGGGNFLEWYPTPGHSPESVCMKVGRLLFIGDILGAVNPLVAGLSGWNHQDFIHSASHIIWLLEHTDVSWCCPGHGNTIPAPLGNRAKSLLLDFINAAKGLRNPEELVATDLNGLVQETLHDLRKSPHDDNTILDTVDDEGKFLSALASRIAYVPLFEDVRLTFAPGGSLPLAHVVAARIADTLADFLGFLAGRDCREICLSTAWEEEQGEIRIRCPGKDIRETVGEAKWKSFVRRFGMGGLTLSAQEQCLRLRTG